MMLDPNRMPEAEESPPQEDIPIQDLLRELYAELSYAEQREGRRVARVLHDEVKQTLEVVRIGICELRNSERSKERAARLEELCELVDRTIKVTRSLTFQLSPPVLQDLGLEAALRALGEQMQQHCGSRFEFTLAEGWSPTGETTGAILYGVVRELLLNVTHHARAGRVRLELDGTGVRNWLVLEDDGVGFDAAGNGRAAAGSDIRSLGLLHVREWMEGLGGLFQIDSVPGRGTRAVLSLPVPQSGEPDPTSRS